MNNLDFYFNAPAEECVIHKLNSEIKFHLPDDYLFFLEKNNGGEGFINDEFVILWKAEELVLFNQEYEVDKYVENIFFIGSNGGGEAIAYDLIDMSVVFIPFIGMDRKYIINKSKDFTGFFYGE